MLSSIATVSLSGTLDTKLRAIAAARFGGVEIFENDLLTYSGSVADVRAMLDDFGLICTCFQPFRDFEGAPAELRARTFERAERKFDLMQQLGAPLLLVCSSVSPSASGERSRLIDDFRALGERASTHGLRVGFEALAWGRHINDHRDAWSLVKAVNHPAIGLILDSFHSLARNVPLASLSDIDVGKLFLVQLADAPMLQMDPLSWSRHFRCMPGQGDFPLVDYMAPLVEAGYTGPWSLEIFNDRFRAASSSMVAIDGKRSLTFLADQVARRTGRDPNGLLPPRARCRGISFIEFAANESEVEPLTHMFAGLGLCRAGKHRNKQVTRWCQGDINFVINSEPDSFARTYDEAHGASVCAIGLRLEQVPQAMRRAAALQMSSFAQPHGPGELSIPSILGPGGNLIYFVEVEQEQSIWRQEFIADVGSVPSDTGLLSVDHLELTLQHEAIPSWLLYYLSLIDVAKGQVTEIPDPVGLVYSQPIQSSDGALRFVLNASASPQTLPSRFLQHYMGAGIQSISLMSRDIIATARELRKRELPLLPIPQNYYEDLAARYNLSEQRVEELAELNILYDADATGEYFQLFSRAFAKRFFFEIVMRRKYDGYGAANAAVRLAAQSRYKTAVPEEFPQSP
jgi:4-hydroxyphenylpyruvate dioxygenase